MALSMEQYRGWDKMAASMILQMTILNLFFNFFFFLIFSGVYSKGLIDSEPAHYNDVRMDAIASQITSLTIVYSTVYSDADQRKHQSSASLAFRRIHRWPVNSPHKWPVTRKMFPFDDVIMICSNDSLAPNGRQVVMGANGGIVYRSIYTRPEWVETPNSGTIFISSVPL